MKKNGNSVFSVENNSMSTSLGKKFVTLEVTTKMSKLVDNACLSCPYFRVLPQENCLTNLYENSNLNGCQGNEEN